MHPVDVSAYSNRWGRYHPGQKVVLACGMLLLCLILPPFFAGPVILFGMTGLALFVARVPANVYLRYLALGAGFAMVGAVPLLFSIGRAPDALRLTISFSFDGAWLAARVFIRATASMACLLFLATTTPLADLISQFRKIGLPGAVIEIMQLIYRMLWLLDDVSRQVRVAQAARMGYCGMKQSFRSTYMLASGLFFRIMNRAQRMETGLAARGYNGSLNVLVESKPLSIAGISVILMVQGLLVVLSFIFVRAFPWLR